MDKLIDFDMYAIKTTLKQLLKDKSTKNNIIWATNTYEHLGPEFDDKKEIKEFTLINGFKLKPRITKSEETQLERTKKKAEVFTPSWLVNQMNNYCDEEWFGKNNIFNIEEDNSWDVINEKITFPDEKKWKDYIYSTRLEITCGEAPFLVSRYDVSTGEKLVPTTVRMGMLDRKLRIVNENTDEKEEWIEWAIKAVQSCYGYEYQGDNLLLARMNILLTYVEYYEERWNEKVEEKILQKIANIISWNIWQMDGLTDTVPFGAPYEEHKQISMFDLEEKEEKESIPCRIFDWRGNKSIRFMDLKERKMKKFDFVIGNPPYQEETIGDNKTYAPPVYNLFLDEAFKIADKVEMIHPARFLFNAGSTPKAWNKKMLKDEHFKVLYYEEHSDKIFIGTDIKGGLAITYRDTNRDFGKIDVFTPYKELNSVINKVYDSDEFKSFSKIVITSYAYHFTKKLYIDYPHLKNALSKGHEYDFKSNVFEKMSEIFFTNKPDNGEYLRILGRIDNKRQYKYINKRYVNDVKNLYSYKIFLPGAIGSGKFGEKLSTSIMGLPGDGSTETFLSIGSFNDKKEAIAVSKYIKTKFARSMLGILKRTQANTPAKWKYVPLQDFTVDSDIDWSKSIAEIDQQLYKKYGLNEEEINFIETNVKEME